MMYPAYKWTDSYPYHTDPRAKEIDRGMNSPYYPWPYASNHCYPVHPQSCHSCCNHSYFGGPYSFTPPYPHYPPPPPPPQFHAHGFYPPFPGAHPAYSFPPSHYSMEQPRYDYDKNTPTPTPHHCCGCEKKSTIEPQEPEVEKKKTSESLVPFFKDSPYSVMWVPPTYMNTESNAKEKEKENPVVKPLEPSKQVENDKIAQDQQQGEVGNRFPFPIFWLPATKNDEAKKDMNLGENIRKNDDDDVESEKSSKHGVQKVIPVKQLGTKEEKKASQKTSKLPPVCLRIDPLPKKKNSSRSPSPPGDTKRLKGSAVEDSKSFQQQTESSQDLLKNDSKKVEKDSVVDPCSEKGAEEDRSKVENNKRKLSENEAVLMIQAVYRGFEVRKSQPLMKLREIAQVGKQVAELRNRIQDLGSSMRIDEKQKLVIGETIMSLLLKLDTIQGLHPVVRDVRKSVAKELVGLQEKLDSITQSKQTTIATTSADEDETITQPQEATESQNHDGGEARNYSDFEPQVELQNGENSGDLDNNHRIELEQPVVVHHEKAQSDHNNDDHQVGAENPVTQNMKPQEHLVEQSFGELDNDQVQAAMETDKPVDDIIQEKSGKIPMELEQPVDNFTGHEKAQFHGEDEAVRLNLDNHEVEAADPPTHDMKLQDPVEQSSGGLDNDQFQMAVETQHHEDVVIQEKSDRAQSESGTRLETMVSDVCECDGGAEEARDIDLNPQVVVEHSGDPLEMAEEIEPPVEAEEEDQREALDSKIVGSVENLTTAMDLGAVESETGKLGEKAVDQEEAPTVDDVDGGSKEAVMEEREAAPALSATGSHVSSGGDKKLMEENEKLRVAMEELMKAGSEQVSVIRELTGRVKDLEKKLLKRKRKVKKSRSSRRPRGSLVEEELRV